MTDDNKNIHDANFLLGHSAKPDCDVICVVSYEGDIGNSEPQEIHIDTQLKKISVIFNDGSKSDLFNLTQDNVDVIDQLCREVADANKGIKKSLAVDFNQVDPTKTGTAFFKQCYRVNTLLI